MTADPAALSRAADWLRLAKNVIVFTGAGVSAESGIATFRDDGGFWSRFPPERFATWNGLTATAATHPRELAEFLLAVLEPVSAAQPNPGHEAIARLEQFTRVTVITQNVDGLHQEAGSRTVHEVHGSLFEVVTLNGRPVRRINKLELGQIVQAIQRSLDGWFVLPKLLAAVNPILGLGTTIYRPGIVFFGEAMAEPAWRRSLEAARCCDLMLVVGTSGEVYPASMLPDEARAAGANVVGIGPERTVGDVWLKGRSGEILPALVDLLSSNKPQGET